MKDKLVKGQAAILIIFVVGMVSLSMGMSLTKTGFQESIMSRGTAGSTKAFYVANSGIEDALHRIKDLTEDELPNKHELTVINNVDENKKGIANVTIMTVGVEEEDGGVITTDREILSVGKYGNFVRRIRVRVQNTLIAPDFTRFIQAGIGGIQIGQNVHISSSDSVGGVNISSASFVLGRNNGTEGGCTNASTEIDGNVFAYGNIGKLDTNGTGPCITGNAYAKSLDYCRVFGEIYSEGVPSVNCPFNRLCDPSDPICAMPDQDDLKLPNVGAEYIEDYLEDLEDSQWNGGCEIGGVNDCSTPNADGSSTIGNLIINGNLETNSNSELHLSGHVLVRGDITFDSNQEIRIDPSYENESSLIMLVEGKVNASANTHFYSDIFGDVSRFLLVASKYESEDLLDGGGGLCEGSLGDNAIKIEPNVQSILFYAMNGCAYLKATASEAFLGAILAQGVYIDNNVNIIYNPSLRDAKFFLKGQDAWEILSFTEE